MRKLFFTDQELYFERDSLICREAVDTHPELLENKRKPRGHPYFGLFGLRNRDIPKHIESYSRRELTYNDDVLNALSGIFRAFEKLPSPVYQILGVPILGNPRNSMTWTQQFA